MAIIHFVNYRRQSPAGLRAVLNYTVQDKKTVQNGKKFVTGVNCQAASALTEFQNTKRLYGKTDGRQFFHFVQSFPAGMDVSPATAHEIALRLTQESEKLRGFEIVVSTHCDRDHIHSHFILNSVNAETGKKFHITQPEIEDLMRRSDRLCREYGLETLDPVPPRQKVKPMSDREYRSADKNQSWKLKLAIDIDDVMCFAASRPDFVRRMEEKGYAVKWTATRKYITYTIPGGPSCRDNKLHEKKYLKEEMEHEFRIREEILGGIESPVAAGGKSRALRRRHGEELGGVNRDAEFTDRAAAEHSGAAGYAGDGGTPERAYEPADEYPDGICEDCGQGLGGVQQYGGATVGGHSEGSEGLEGGSGETGWEAERAVFEQSLGGPEDDREGYEEVVLDQPDPDGASYSLGIGAAYLAGDLMGIVQSDRRVQDSTTMRQPHRRKKDQEQGGPVMGGL